MKKEEKQVGSDVRKDAEEQVRELLMEEMQIVGGGDNSDAVV